MDTSLVSLLAANIAFVGTHFLMSHAWRRPIQALSGNRGFMIVYSVVSLILFVWIIMAFRSAPTGDLPGTGEIGWIISTAIMLPALILFAGSYVGNPAMPMPGADEAARAEPKGVFAITRHPMMWGFALWAASHLLLYYSWRTMIAASAMGFLALVGARMQDRKKRATMGPDWDLWESRTSYWPRLHKFFSAGLFPWAAGLILFVFLSWLHIPMGGIPAGIWRWF
ncbi:MAG: NnrU family protein [Marinomonas sp.]